MISTVCQDVDNPATISEPAFLSSTEIQPTIPGVPITRIGASGRRKSSLARDPCSHARISRKRSRNDSIASQASSQCHSIIKRNENNNCNKKISRGNAQQQRKLSMNKCKIIPNLSFDSHSDALSTPFNAQNTIINTSNNIRNDTSDDSGFRDRLTETSPSFVESGERSDTHRLTPSLVDTATSLVHQSPFLKVPEATVIDSALRRSQRTMSTADNPSDSDTRPGLYYNSAFAASNLSECGREEQQGDPDEIRFADDDPSPSDRESQHGAPSRNANYRKMKNGPTLIGHKGRSNSTARKLLHHGMREGPTPGGPGNCNGAARRPASGKRHQSNLFNKARLSSRFTELINAQEGVQLQDYLGEEEPMDWRKRLKLALPHVGLVLIAIAYAVIGASLFYSIERPHEIKMKRQSINDIYNSRRLLLSRLWEISQKNEGGSEVEFWLTGMSDMENITDELFHSFDHHMLTASEIRKNTSDVVWTFPAAIFFAVTVVTTIGYGNPVPLTMTGRLVCVIYALFGIPLTLITIADVGKFCSENLIWFYTKYFSCKYKLQCWYRRSNLLGRLKKAFGARPKFVTKTVTKSKISKGLVLNNDNFDASGHRKHRNHRSVRENRHNRGDTNIPDEDNVSNNNISDNNNNNTNENINDNSILDNEVGSIPDADGNGVGVDDEEQIFPDDDDEICEACQLDDKLMAIRAERRIPATLVLVLLLSYTALGGFILAALERWHYLDAFYFSFITMTTIGFGDIIPSKDNAYLVFVMVYIVVGLAITTMCIDLVGIQYIRKIHYFGRQMRHARTALAFVGGKAVYMQDFLVNNMVGRRNGAPGCIGGGGCKSLNLAITQDGFIIDGLYLPPYVGLWPFIPADIRRIRYIDDASDSFNTSCSDSVTGSAVGLTGGALGSLLPDSCAHCKFCRSRAARMSSFQLHSPQVPLHMANLGILGAGSFANPIIAGEVTDFI